ncbi:MAG: two-component system response regulator [Rhodospirillaceae bacterium]|nr:MAG: two-component system response regulator [Rhodospirillaceae bacterium]
MLKIPQPRVIIIDDDGAVRNLISALLVACDCEVVGQAATGKLGVDLYKEQKPDLVLLDVQMPEMDGLQALKKILNVNNDAMVVLLTGLDNTLVAENAYLSGAKGYIRKDLELAELKNRILEEVGKIKPH